MTAETNLKRFHKYIEPKLLKMKKKLEERMAVIKPEDGGISKAFDEGKNSGLQIAIDMIDGMIDGQKELREIYLEKDSPDNHASFDPIDY